MPVPVACDNDYVPHVCKTDPAVKYCMDNIYRDKMRDKIQKELNLLTAHMPKDTAFAYQYGIILAQLIQDMHSDSQIRHEFFERIELLKQRNS